MEFNKIFGEYLNYEIDINSDNDTRNDWQIFYKGTDSICLIASEIVTPPQQTSYVTIKEKYIYGTSKTSLKNYLNNQNFWTEFKNSYAERVEVAPSLEMFISLWNNVSDTKLYYSGDTTGHLVGTTSEVKQKLSTEYLTDPTKNKLFKIDNNYWIADYYSNKNNEPNMCSKNKQ